MILSKIVNLLTKNIFSLNIKYFLLMKNNSIDMKSYK